MAGSIPGSRTAGGSLAVGSRRVGRDRFRDFQEVTCSFVGSARKASQFKFERSVVSDCRIRNFLSLNATLW